MHKLILLFLLLVFNSCEKEKDNDPVQEEEKPILSDRVPCVDEIPETPYKIRYDYTAAVDIIPERNVIDCSMIPIGSPNVPGFEIWRDPNMLYNGKPSYHFKMKDQSERRVEFQNVYVTQSDIDEAGLTEQEVSDHQLTRSLYHFGKGEAKKGETWIYEYGLYLPETITSQLGIITQWHGMPDRTTIHTPTNDTIYYKHSDFISQILSKMYFNQSIGYDKQTEQPNGYILDYGGNPPVALRVRNGYLYLLARLDRARITNDRDERIHIYPPNNFPESATSPEGNKTVFGVWSKPLSEIPLNEWIDMKFEIRWSNFAEDGSGVLDEGNIKIFMNGELMADWTGYVGNNDEHGTFFKYGLYVPGENGLEIRVGDFRQHKKE